MKSYCVPCCHFVILEIYDCNNLAGMCTLRYAWHDMLATSPFAKEPRHLVTSRLSRANWTPDPTTSNCFWRQVVSEMRQITSHLMARCTFLRARKKRFCPRLKTTCLKETAEQHILYFKSQTIKYGHTTL